MHNFKRFIVVFSFIILFSAADNFAQGTAFVYQGKLNDGAAAANGTYQFEFRLFDAASGGAQIGQTLADFPATVTNGIFSVNLDFGANAFDGAGRFLEISVRLNGSGQPYTLLTPRQAVTSTPYAVKSLKANEATTAITSNDSLNLGGLAAAQYVQTNDSRMSDDRSPLPGSTNYIQNTTSQQAASNFNISGAGKAGVLDAATQFNLNGVRILTGSQGLGNLFIGAQSGEANSSVGANTFVGVKSGKFTTTGYQNSFFGQSAGLNNLGGHDNSMFGNFVGALNTSGSANAFFGAGTGYNNTTGNDNAFFGMEAGGANTTGSGNTFLGRLAGLSNTVENNNTFIGYKANGAANITNATAIGANAVVTQSNSMVLGTNAVTVQVPGNLTVANTFSANALNSAMNYQIGGVRIFHKTGTDNLFAGIDAGNVATGGFNAFFGAQAGKFNTTGFNNTFVGAYAGRDNTTGTNNAFFGANAGLSNTTAVGNSFFGSNAGLSNSTGAGNSFFGNASGLNNTTGLNNSFLGAFSGQANTTGANNAFFGFNSGLNNSDGFSNSFFGASSGKANTTGNNNAFFGYNAGTGNTTGGGNSFFGNASGQSNTTGASNVFVGTNAGLLNSTGSFNVFVGRNSATLSTTGNNNTFLGYNAGSSVTNGGDNVFLGWNAGSTGNVFNSIAIGSNVKVTSSNTAQIGSANMTVKMPGEVELGKSLKVGGGINVTGLSTFGTSVDINGSLVVANYLGADTFNFGNGSAGQLVTSHLTSINGIFTGLLNAAKIKINPNNATGGFVDTMCLAEDDNTLRTCFLLFSEMKNVQEFKGGTDVIKNLRPVTYNQDGSSERAVGLVRTNSNFADPMFVKRDLNNQVNGIRQQQIIPALVSAAQEQQTQIDEQKAENQKLQEQIKSQQAQLDALKALVCASNPNAAVCQPK